MNFCNYASCLHVLCVEFYSNFDENRILQLNFIEISGV